MMERVEIDRPGHLIVSDQCRFFLHTRVGKWRISTIGDWRPEYAQGEQRDIGWGRAYETMVFELGDDGEPVDWSERETDGYSTEEEARAGHEAMVARYSVPGCAGPDMMPLEPEVAG